MSGQGHGTCMGRLVSRLVIGDLLVRRAGDISLSRPNFGQAAARSGGQGWPKAIAKRLALDDREHTGGGHCTYKVEPTRGFVGPGEG
jgi:hypothetical protein